MTNLTDIFGYVKLNKLNITPRELVMKFIIRFVSSYFYYFTFKTKMQIQGKL